MFEERLAELKAFLLNSHPKHRQSPVSIDALLDALIAIYDDCKTYSAEKNSTIPKFLQKYGPVVNSIRDLRVNKNDFTFVKRLAKGQFGEVSLVRGKWDNKVYAMKTLRKAEMLKQNEIAFFMEEKEILSVVESKWTTSFLASFQDESNLYIVMEYLPGGDLASLLMKADEGELKIDENFVRFYTAECLLALEELHKHNYVHRDFKPGNILLDSRGHVRLADFGSCIYVDEKTGVTSSVSVGTPDYISPEVLQSNEGKGSYGKECDFWSLGITLYELLVGDPPFYAESLAETYHQIMNHQKYFNLPNDITVSSEAVDLMKKLICDRKDRLKTAADIKKHPFFKGINWDKIHEQKPPFVPKLQGDDDVSNFLEYEDFLDESTTSSKPGAAKGTDKVFSGQQLNFVGFTNNKKASLIEVLASKEALASLKSAVTTKSDNGLDLKLQAAEAEVEKLKSRLVAEQKKITAMESSQSTLESQLKSLRKTVDDTQKTVESKETAIAQLGREKKVNELELQNFVKKFQQLNEEKGSIERKLAKLNEDYDKEAKNSSQYKDQSRKLTDEKARLETDLKTARSQVTSQQEKISRLENDIANLNKTKAVLEVELADVKRQFEEEQLARDEIEAELEAIEARLEKENNDSSFAKEALEKAESVISALRQELETSNATLLKELSEKEILKQKLNELELSRGSAEREITSLKVRIEEMSLSAQRTVETTSPTKEKRSSVLGGLFSRDKSADMAKQIEVEAEMRKKVTDDLNKALHEKKVLELQLNDSKMKLAEADKELNQFKVILKKIEMQNVDSSKRGTMTMGRSSASRGNDEESKAILEKKIGELQKNNALAQIEITDLKRRLGEETGNRASIETRVKQLEQQLTDDAQARSTLEKKLFDIEAQYNSAAKDLSQARADYKKLSSTNEQQNEKIQNQQKTIALLQIERDDVSNKYGHMIRIKTELEAEASKLKQRLSEVLTNTIDPDEFTNIAEECNRVHREMNELQAKYDSLSMFYKQVVAENEAWKKKHEQDVVKIAELNRKSQQIGGSTDDLQVDAADGRSKRDRVINTKMKALEQKLNNEIARRAALESELAAVRQTKQLMESELDDVKKQLHAAMERPVSINTTVGGSAMNVMKHPSEFLKGRRLRPLLFPEHSEQPTMQGWLKMRIPKTGKLAKFDWLKKYAVLRDSKLFLFDKEKDKDLTNVHPFLDLKNDLFLIRSVKPKELIHLSTKEVTYVFTIHVVVAGFQSMASLDRLALSADTMPEPEILHKKIEVLEESIQKELRFKEATEKMIRVSTGDVRKRTQSELDECTRRLKVLRQEKMELEVQVGQTPRPHADDNTSLLAQSIADMRPLSPHTDDHSQEILNELEKKEAYQKGVQNMLDVVTNENTRNTLTRQLSGVKKEIQTLRSSLENLGTSISSNQLTKSSTKIAQTYEFKGHNFRVRTSTPNTVNGCYHCHESFFGSNQTLECTNCRLACHRFCYQLVGVACQEHIQFRRAQKWYFMANDESDKTRWVTGLDCVRANFREDPNRPMSPNDVNDIDSLLGIS